MRVTGILSGAVKAPAAVHIYRITLPLHYIHENTDYTCGWVDAKSAAMSITPQELEVVLDSDIIVLAPDYKQL